MRLKTINIKSVLPLLLPLATGLFSGCAKDGEEAATPIAQISVSSRSLAVNESMTLRFTGVADQVVVFTGDKSHDYALRDSSNTGLVVNKGVLTYSYAAPGVFHVVCVATTYDTFMGDGLKQDTVSVDIVVTDEVTDIDAVSTTVTPNVYYATRQGDDFVLCLPTKQLYNNREMTVNAARQRLSIIVGSDSAKVYVDGNAHVAKNYYDLSTDHRLKVVSGSGKEHEYTLYCLVYPEFASITVDGAAPTLQRSAYYQDLLTYAANGTTLSFTLDAGVELLADGEPVVTGSAIRRDADYTLVRTHDSNPEVKAVTRVKFISQQNE